MNPDKLAPGERCALTSSRNFEGRQGFRGRTHLVSPVMAAAAVAGAVRGYSGTGLAAACGCHAGLEGEAWSAMLKIMPLPLHRNGGKVSA